MIDYYAFLLRAVEAADPADAAARREVYDRARQILGDQLQARQPPVSDDELRDHYTALESAIVRLERECAKAFPAPAAELRRQPQVAPRPAAPGRAAPRQAAPKAAPRRPAASRSEPGQAEPGQAEPGQAEPSQAEPLESPPMPSRSHAGLWVGVVVAVLVAAIGAGGYVAWTAWSSLSRRPAPPSSSTSIEAAVREPLLRRRPTVTASTVDLAPGIDGGSTDADLPLIFRRQRVFYRTTLPTGTIVVDKPQHFIYLVLPNSTALRYGIGVGNTCAELIGLRKVASKTEWPPWQPPAGSARIDPLPGGPGNPLGARLLGLDDNVSSIHGTNAPKTVGDDVAAGCVRLVNDDVADLYNRVPIGTGVVMR